MEKLKNIVSGTTIGISASSKVVINFFAHYGVDPVMVFTVSGALVYGPIYGFIIGASTMVIADFMLSLVGLWTIYTALAFGLVGFLAGLIGKFKKNFTRIELAGLTLLLTLLFDVIAMTAFAFQFGIPLYSAAISQIPVTLIHTAWNMAMAFALAPSLMKIMSTISSPKASVGFWKRIGIGVGNISAIRTKS